MLSIPSIAPILLIFYLYLLVRWQHVKRPTFYLLGVLGIMLVLVAQFFSCGQSKALMVLTIVFTYIGLLVTFAGAVLACFGGELPAGIAKQVDKAEQSGGAPPQA